MNNVYYFLSYTIIAVMWINILYAIEFIQRGEAHADKFIKDNPFVFWVSILWPIAIPFILSCDFIMFMNKLTKNLCIAYRDRKKIKNLDKVISNFKM